MFFIPCPGVEVLNGDIVVHAPSLERVGGLSGVRSLKIGVQSGFRDGVIIHGRVVVGIELGSGEVFAFLYIDMFVSASESENLLAVLLRDLMVLVGIALGSGTGTGVVVQLVLTVYNVENICDETFVGEIHSVVLNEVQGLLVLVHNSGLH